MKHKDLIISISQKYNLKPSWVMAVIEIESSYNESPTPRYEKHIKDWSFGYGQILTGTAVWLAQAKIVDSGVAQALLEVCETVCYKGFRHVVSFLEDGKNNIHMTCAYLSHQMKRYGDIESAVAAYNAGSVRRKDDGSFVNQHHVDKFINALNRIEAQNEYLKERNSSGLNGHFGPP